MQKVTSRNRVERNGDYVHAEQHRSSCGVCSRTVLCIENHPNDSRVKIRDDNVCQSLTGRMGTGGGNVPLVLVYEDIY